jgi:hypothetical protein
VCVLLLVRESSCRRAMRGGNYLPGPTSALRAEQAPVGPPPHGGAPTPLGPWELSGPGRLRLFGPNRRRSALLPMVGPQPHWGRGSYLARAGFGPSGRTGAGRPSSPWWGPNPTGAVEAIWPRPTSALSARRMPRLAVTVESDCELKAASCELQFFSDEPDQEVSLLAYPEHQGCLGGEIGRSH